MRNKKTLTELLRKDTVGAIELGRLASVPFKVAERFYEAESCGETISEEKLIEWIFEHRQTASENENDSLTNAEEQLADYIISLSNKDKEIQTQSKLIDHKRKNYASYKLFINKFKESPGQPDYFMFDTDHNKRGGGWINRTVSGDEYITIMFSRLPNIREERELTDF